MQSLTGSSVEQEDVVVRRVEQTRQQPPVVQDIRIHQQDRRAAAQHLAALPERDHAAVAERRVVDQRNAATALVPRHLLAQIRGPIANRYGNLAHPAGIENREVPRQQAVAAEAQHGLRRDVHAHSPAASGGKDQGAAEGTVKLHCDRIMIDL